MDDIKTQLNHFFNEYNDLFNKAIKEDNADIKRVTAMYADCFIGANPSGVSCSSNSAISRTHQVKFGHNII